MRPSKLRNCQSWQCYAMIMACFGGGLKQGEVYNMQCSWSWWWEDLKREPYKGTCRFLQTGFQDKTSKSSKEFSWGASSNPRDILDTCSLSTVPAPGNYTSGSSRLKKKSRKKVQITEWRAHSFVVSDLLQAHGETKLKIDTVFVLKHYIQVKETGK